MIEPFAGRIAGGPRPTRGGEQLFETLEEVQFGAAGAAAPVRAADGVQPFFPMREPGQPAATGDAERDAARDHHCHGEENSNTSAPQSIVDQFPQMVREPPEVFKKTGQRREPFPDGIHKGIAAGTRPVRGQSRHIVAPEKLHVVDRLRPLRRPGIRRARGIRGGVQPPPAATRVALPAGQIQFGHFVGRQVYLHPSVRVPLTELPVVPHRVVFATLITVHDARRDPLAAQHQRQRRGEILAMARPVFGDKRLDRILIGRSAETLVERIAVAVRLQEVRFQHPHLADRVSVQRLGFAQDLLGGRGDPGEPAAIESLAIPHFLKVRTLLDAIPKVRIGQQCSLPTAEQSRGSKTVLPPRADHRQRRG